MMQQPIPFSYRVPIHRLETFKLAVELHVFVDSILCFAQQKFSSNRYENEENGLASPCIDVAQVPSNAH
jgi:hypothetical protein